MAQILSPANRLSVSVRVESAFIEVVNSKLINVD